MVSADQVDDMEFDKPGFLGNVALNRTLISRLSFQWSVRGAVFLSKEREGGLLGTLVGLRIHPPEERAVKPYLSVDAGVGATGKLVRPWFGVMLGVDWWLDEHWQAGPVVGVDDFVQWNGGTYSTDAAYVWVGVSFSYGNRPVPPPPAPPAPVRVRVVERVEVEVQGEPVVERVEIKIPPEPGADREIERLMERMIGPSQRLELLAPVLFAVDSDQLEPIGVGMLHEVARTLKMRPEILRLEIQGYADARGSTAYNQALSQRRAERVRSWLIEHGIGPERLSIAPQGERDPVEDADSESALQQNRRVVFRVLELAAP